MCLVGADGADGASIRELGESGVSAGVKLAEIADISPIMVEKIVPERLHDGIRIVSLLIAEPLPNHGLCPLADHSADQLEGDGSETGAHQAVIERCVEVRRAVDQRSI